MRRRIWLWFACGFIVTFCLLAVSITKYTVLPSGNAVAPLKLWRFYVNEWPKFLGAELLGPASGSRDSLIIVTLQHILLATGGGIVVAGLAAWLRRRGRSTG